MPIKATTQRHLLIADVVDDILLTKAGGATLILRSSALNFSLLSQREQEAITFAHAALLNSLSFPIQILVRSQRKDVSDYLDFLANQETKQENEKLKGLMSSYREFVLNMVKKKNVLEKEFFIIIPFSPFETGISPRGVLNLVSPKNRRSVPFSKEYITKKAKTILYPRRDHIIRQVGRLGIKLKQLTTEEILQLFSKIYTLEKGEPNNGIS